MNRFSLSAAAAAAAAGWMEEHKKETEKKKKEWVGILFSLFPPISPGWWFSGGG
jgi:uncharacterized protein YfiM (DUF2279 family)